MRKNVLEYLESSARMHADKPAFCDENRVFTFGELLKAAQGLGTHLAGTVDTLHKPVAVLIGRTAESVAAMQGVLYAGGCYVPIDNHMPEARIRRIFEQVHPVAIVYAEGNRKQAEPLADCAPLISMDEGFAAPADADLLQSIRESVLDIDPVYLLFTSGSTGAPKGIVIPHRAVIDFTDWMSEFCGYTEHDIFGNQAPFYFDLSCKDLYQTLSLGATCHIFSKKLFTFPMLLLKEMERVGVTAINWATSAFHFVASSGALSKCAPPTLRKAALGGEALQARYVNAWKAAIPGLEVVNMYGPTETTVDCAAFHLTRDYRDDEAIPIGKACRNMQIILLDKDGKSVPDGEAGEICVRGSGLASGYFGNWEKTNECFIQNPTNPYFRDILYRTGDIAVKKDDGLLYFLSRQDGQIKHMGYRIELGEIETALHSVDGIAAAACLFDRNRDRIVCIYEGEPDAAALARAMRRLVSKYMLPNIYEKLDALPMNANGKIDRVKLKEQFIHAED